MAVTDQQLLASMIYRMLENGNTDANPTGPLLTSMFTQQQMLDALNRAQQQFLLDTGMNVSQTQLPGIVGQSKYDLPQDAIRPRRLTWTGD